MKVFSVKYNEIRGKTFETRVRAESARHALGKAVAKIFGEKCWFHHDSGIESRGSRFYGQVFKPARLGGDNAVTGSSWVDVTIGMKRSNREN